jgi:hypothetical protein
MKRLLFYVVAVTVATAWLAAAATADWNVGDPFKMHYPQLPNPDGWDVKFSQGLLLADDWMCTASGPVSDIHFWFSVLSDQSFGIGQIPNIHVSIHADIPAGQSPQGYSIPGTELWWRDIQAGQFTIRPYGEGDQGWFDPMQEVILQHDHKGIWQVNVTNILEPFQQEEGKIYWLDLAMTALDVQLGWKTSVSPHFGDDAVWVMPDSLGWGRLTDPLSGESLDMAFVITPEPGTFVLLGIGVLGLLAYAWHRRRA